MHIQKKRQEFHTQIRKKVISDHFRQRRRQILYLQEIIYHENSQQNKQLLQIDFRDLIDYMRDYSLKIQKDLSIGNFKQITNQTKQLYYKIKNILKKLATQGINKLINIYFQLRLDSLLIQSATEILQNGSQIDKQEIALHVTSILYLIFKYMNQQPLQLDHKKMYQFLFKALIIKKDSRHLLHIFGIINNLVELMPSTKYSILMGIGYQKSLIWQICFAVSKIQLKPKNSLTNSVVLLFLNYFEEVIELQNYFHQMKKLYPISSSRQVPAKEKQNIRFIALQINNGIYKDCLKKEHHQLILKVAINCFNSFCQQFYNKQNTSILTQSIELIKLTLQASQIKPQRVELNYQAMVEILNARNAATQLKSQILYLIDLVIYKDQKDTVATMLVKNYQFVKRIWSLIDEGYQITIFNILCNLLLINESRQQVVRLAQNITIWLFSNKMSLKSKIQFVYNYFAGRREDFQIQGELDKLVLTVLQFNDINQYNKQNIEQQSIIWYRLMEGGYPQGLPSKYNQMLQKNMFIETVCKMLAAQQHFNKKFRF